MLNQLFVLSFAAIYAVLLVISCRKLPLEKWQFALSIPTHKEQDGSWHGLNVTYYGILTANALIISLALLLIMLGALQMGLKGILFFILPLLAICIPASGFLARIIEKKPATLTIGGASFVGLIVAPGLIFLVQVIMGIDAGFLPILSAITVCYAFGEGLGRLACVSFGCCYGKPLENSPLWAQRLFKNRAFVFYGKTKKIVYESNLEGKRVLPIQAVTSVIYVVCGLVGLYLFLMGHFRASFLISLTVTALWRAYSETLRADFRGNGKLTVYQWMALVSVPYGVLMTVLLPLQKQNLIPQLSLGMDLVWHPGVLLLLQGLWVIILIHSGASKVTSATINFHLVKNKI